MKIILAKNAGFCFGVESAFNKIIEIASKTNETVNTLGPLIHNPQTIEQLKKEYDVGYINHPEEAQKGTIVIRAHGVSPETIVELEKKGLNVINATCPYVMKTQKYASTLHEEGKFVVIIGDPKHPEVISILGHAKGDGVAIENISEVANLPKNRKIGVVIQSTYIPAKAQKITNEIESVFSDCVIYDTICNVTQNRQDEAKEISKICDFVLVIGGKNSANTEKLRQIAVLEGAEKVQKIESLSDVNFKDFQNVQNLGILAGASTPSWLIDKIVSAIQKNYPNSKIINHNSKK